MTWFFKICFFHWGFVKLVWAWQISLCWLIGYHFQFSILESYWNSFEFKSDIEKAQYDFSVRQNISTRKLIFHTMVMMLISFLEFLENDKRVTQQLLKLHELQVLKLQVWYPSMPGETTVRFLNFSPILRFVIFLCIYTKSKCIWKKDTEYKK